MVLFLRQTFNELLCSLWQDHHQIYTTASVWKCQRNVLVFATCASVCLSATDVRFFQHVNNHFHIGPRATTSIPTPNTMIIQCSGKTKNNKSEFIAQKIKWISNVAKTKPFQNMDSQAHIQTLANARTSACSPIHSFRPWWSENKTEIGPYVITAVVSHSAKRTQSVVLFRKMMCRVEYILNGKFYECLVGSMNSIALI